jgi:hypothetical protein
MGKYSVSPFERITFVVLTSYTLMPEERIVYMSESEEDALCAALRVREDPYTSTTLGDKWVRIAQVRISELVDDYADQLVDNYADHPPLI